MDIVEMDSVFWIGTYSTLGMTIVAFLRVYWIRSYYDKRREEKI